MMEPWELVPPEDRVAIPEDEMRAILGLPDMKPKPYADGGMIGGMGAFLLASEAAFMSDWGIYIEWLRVATEKAATSMRIFAEVIARADGAAEPDFAAKGKAIPRPSSRPPFWATDHRRRGRAGRNHL